MAFLPNVTFNETSPPPYLECLVPDISVELQEKLRDVANSVFLPLDLIMALLSLLSNLLLLAAVARTKSRQHPSLILLCSLSISDLLWAAFVFYRDIRKATHLHLCPTSRGENAYISILCLFATLSNLAVISKDRHQAVSNAQWYRNHKNRLRTVKEASVSWCLSVVALLLVFMLNRFLPEKRFLVFFVGVVFYVTCVITIIGSYIGIFVANRRQKKNMTQHGRRPLAVLKREKQLAKTIGFILLALVFTLLPALASPIILTIMGYRSKAPFRPFFTVFITFNGLMNPLINCGRNDTIRRSVRDIFVCSRAAKHFPKAAVVPEQGTPLDNKNNHIAAKKSKILRHSSTTTSL
ncbi:melanocyte-stimulating hormone receptor-like [Oculina patagonica]